MLEELDDEDLELIAERSFYCGLGALVATFFFVAIFGFAWGMHGPGGIETVAVLLLLLSPASFLAGLTCSVALWRRTGEMSFWIWWNGIALVVVSLLLL